VGNLKAAITDPENLRWAFWKAARGKHDDADVRRYQAGLDIELRMLRDGMLEGDYPVGNYQRFVVHDPKRRLIHAPAFGERVLHHAIIRVCEPLFDRWLIADTFACRRGKGQWAAVRRAEGFAACNKFFLKLDIRKYFDSIPHDRLLARLERRFKDRWLLEWFARLLGTHQTQPGKGVPIGSLTSQFFANFYLDPLDRWIKEAMRFGGYVRYMDDFGVWGASIGELKEAQLRIEDFLASSLDLAAKDFPVINRCRAGMDFLGCRVWPGYSTLNRRSRRRFRRRMAFCEGRMRLGVWSDLEGQKHAAALLGFVRQVRSWRFRNQVLDDLGRWPKGLEPGDPRRELEQQSAELPVGEPEQQQSGQSQQQHRIPGRPSSDQGRMAQGTEPAAVLSAGLFEAGGKSPVEPPGAGSTACERSGRFVVSIEQNEAMAGRVPSRSGFEGMAANAASGDPVYTGAGAGDVARRVPSRGGWASGFSPRSAGGDEGDRI